MKPNQYESNALPARIGCRQTQVRDSAGQTPGTVAICLRIWRRFAATNRADWQVSPSPTGCSLSRRHACHSTAPSLKPSGTAAWSVNTSRFSSSEQGEPPGRTALGMQRQRGAATIVNARLKNGPPSARRTCTASGERLRLPDTEMHRARPRNKPLSSGGRCAAPPKRAPVGVPPPRASAAASRPARRRWLHRSAASASRPR